MLQHQRISPPGWAYVVWVRVLQIAQVHLVFGVAGLHLGGAAGILQGIDAVAQALIGQRGEIVPPGGAHGDAVQHAAASG